MQGETKKVCKNKKFAKKSKKIVPCTQLFLQI